MKKINILLVLSLILSSHAFAMKRLHDNKIKNRSDIAFFPFRVMLQVEGNEQVQENCSIVSLSTNSNFFKNYFAQFNKPIRPAIAPPTELPVQKLSQDENGLEALIDIPKSELKYYKIALDWLHGMYSYDIQLEEDIFILFRILKNEWQCEDAFIKYSFEQKINFEKLELGRALCLFNPPPEIMNKNQASYKEIILSCPIIKLKQKYKDIADVHDHKKEYLELPFLAVILIFTNVSFKTDSTDSVFSLLVMWFKENDQYDKIVHFLPLLPVKQFNPSFLVNIFRNFLDECSAKWEQDERKSALIEKLNSYYKLALMVQQATKAGIDVFDKKDLSGQTIRDFATQIGYPIEQHKYADFYDGIPKKFAMKVEFRKANEWHFGEKYYSQPMLSNGYYFSFFIREEKTPGGATTYLAGYVRCTSEACEKQTHYLPAKITLEMHTANNRTRKTEPAQVIFDHFDKSVGSMISQKDFNWEDYRLQKRRNNKIITPDIIINDTLTVIVNIDFLPDGDGGQI